MQASAAAAQSSVALLCRGAAYGLPGGWHRCKPNTGPGRGATSTDQAPKPTRAVVAQLGQQARASGTVCTLSHPISQLRNVVRSTPAEWSRSSYRNSCISKAAGSVSMRHVALMVPATNQSGASTRDQACTCASIICRPLHAQPAQQCGKALMSYSCSTPLGMPSTRCASTKMSFHSRHSRWLCILGCTAGRQKGRAGKGAGGPQVLHRKADPTQAGCTVMP